MTEELEERIREYARRRDWTFRERLGTGVQGIVYVAEDNQNRTQRAVKLHHSRAAYQREREVPEQDE